MGDDLPAVVDVMTAASMLGIGRTSAYQLIRTGGWPTPVLRLGRVIKIPTADLLELLGISPQAKPTSDGAALVAVEADGDTDF